MKLYTLALALIASTCNSLKLYADTEVDADADLDTDEVTVTFDDSISEVPHDQNVVDIDVVSDETFVQDVLDLDIPDSYDHSSDAITLEYNGVDVGTYMYD